MSKDFEDLLHRAAEDLGLPETETPDAESASAARPRVMVVDDDPGMRRALADALEERCALLICPDGIAAVENISDDVDAVILDIKMAGMDGLATFDELRARAPHVPIIFNTGHPGDYPEEDLVGAREPFGYITKGEPKILFALLKSAIRHHRLIQREASLNHHLEHLLEERGAENTRLQRAVQDRYRFDRIIGRSPALRRVFDLMARSSKATRRSSSPGRPGPAKSSWPRPSTTILSGAPAGSSSRTAAPFPKLSWAASSSDTGRGPSPARSPTKRACSKRPTREQFSSTRSPRPLPPSKSTCSVCFRTGRSAPSATP